MLHPYSLLTVNFMSPKWPPRKMEEREGGREGDSLLLSGVIFSPGPRVDRKVEQMGKMGRRCKVRNYSGKI